jgi:SpoVK/Ycf46/Vps4 family AAA+-type ATPase
MVNISENFTRLMRKANFLRLEECKKSGMSLPGIITAPLAFSAAGTNYIRINKDNINAPYETIHVDDRTRNEKCYYMYLNDDDGNQMRIGKGAMSLEELSARVMVNASRKPNEAKNVSGNSEEEIILSMLKKHHFANWKNVIEENNIKIPADFREWVERGEAKGCTFFLRYIDIGEDNPTRVDVITYCPSYNNASSKKGYFYFKPSPYNNLNYSQKSFWQDNPKLESDLVNCERRRFNYYETSAPLYFNKFTETQKAETPRRENSDLGTSKTDKGNNTDKTRKRDEDSDKTIREIMEKSKTSKANGLTFADIGGQDEAIKKMKRTILFPLKYPEAFKNRKISHGVVLYGPPGTGKSLLAEALANESDAHYIKLNGLEMISKWVGQSEENLRKLFEEAKKNQPAVIFIDEFDSIANTRDNGRDPYGAKVVNQLLTLISDIEKNGDNIFIVTATNRLDMLDPAIIRSGRMETHIKLVAPVTTQDVKQIFDIHTKKLNLSEDLNKDEIAKALLEKHATGADIASLINIAAECSLERHDYSPNANSIESVYDKMENGTFKLSDMENLPITNEDFGAAFEEKYGVSRYFRPKKDEINETSTFFEFYGSKIKENANSDDDYDVVID